MIYRRQPDFGYFWSLKMIFEIEAHHRPWRRTFTPRNSLRECVLNEFTLQGVASFDVLRQIFRGGGVPIEFGDDAVILSPNIPITVNKMAVMQGDKRVIPTNTGILTLGIDMLTFSVIATS